MKEKPYSKEYFEDILNNLKKDNKNKIVKASYSEEVKRIQSLFKHKEHAINNLSKEYFELEKGANGNIPSGLHEISIINETLEQVLNAGTSVQMNRIMKAVNEKFRCLKENFHFPKNLKKDYREQIAKAKSFAHISKLRRLFKAKKELINKVTKYHEKLSQKENDSNEHFKDNLFTLIKQVTVSIKHSINVPALKRTEDLFFSKIFAVECLSKEYARLEKNYKGNIPSGLHEISIINLTLLKVMADKSPERINREVNLAKEKIQLLKK